MFANLGNGASSEWLVQIGKNDFGVMICWLLSASDDIHFLAVFSDNLGDIKRHASLDLLANQQAALFIPIPNSERPV